MSSVEILGILSFLFCLYVTVRGAAVQSRQHGQTVKHSLQEAWTNIAIGFTINYTMNLLLLPQVGADLGSELTAWNNFCLGWIYTAVSFMRQFALRRYYNGKTVKHEKQKS